MTSYTAIVEREDNGYVAICPELDVVSQGDTVEEAKANLREAVELFLETADESEIQRRLHPAAANSRLHPSSVKWFPPSQLPSLDYCL